MFKAEKIELTKNTGEYYRALEGYSTLKINDILISNRIYDNTLSINEWQDHVCSECGIEFCNPVGILMVRKQDGKLFIIPDFEQMEGFEEYDYDKDTGNRYCAPHEWYEHGILVIEGEILKKLMELLTGLSIESVKEFTKEEIDLVIDWEEAVRTKPVRFMVRELTINAQTT